MILSLSVREDVSCLSLPCTQLERIEIPSQSQKTHAVQAAGKISFQFPFTNFTFLKLDQNTGYVETKVIPAGARNIRVEEVAGASNYLALRSSSGKWYLNGDWYIQQSGEYRAGGTTIYYKRRHNKETFEALGPTTDELHIMVR